MENTGFFNVREQEETEWLLAEVDAMISELSNDGGHHAVKTDTPT